MNQEIIKAVANDAAQLLAELRLQDEFQHSAYQLVTAAMPAIIAFETGQAGRRGGELTLAALPDDGPRHPVRDTDTPLG